MFKDRRKYKRFNIALEIGYTYSDEDCCIYAKSATINISKGGLAFEMLRIIRNKSKLKVDIKLPGQKDFISAGCRLMWRTGPRQKDEHKQLGGVKFMQLRPEAKARVDDYISALDNGG